MDFALVTKKYAIKRKPIESLSGPDNSLIQCVIAQSVLGVNWWIDNGCHIDLPDIRGWTSIHHAGFVGDFKILKLLLGTVRRNCRERLALKNWEGETPLMVACKSETVNPNVIYHMLMCGAEVNAVNNNGETALCFACMNLNNIKVIKMLVTMGGDITTPRYLGSPITRAMQNYLEVETVKYLLRHARNTFVWDAEMLQLFDELCQLTVRSAGIVALRTLSTQDFAVPAGVFRLLLFRTPGCCAAICRMLRMDSFEVLNYFNKPFCYPYVFEDSFEDVFKAVPSEHLNVFLLNAIILKSNLFIDRLDVILKRLYRERIDIKLDKELCELSPEMCVFVASYVFITPVGCITLKDASRKALAIHLISTFKTFANIRIWLESAPLPYYVKEDLIPFFKIDL